MSFVYHRTVLIISKKNVSKYCKIFVIGSSLLIFVFFHFTCMVFSDYPDLIFT